VDSTTPRAEDMHGSSVRDHFSCWNYVDLFIFVVPLPLKLHCHTPSPFSSSFSAPQTPNANPLYTKGIQPPLQALFVMQGTTAPAMSCSFRVLLRSWGQHPLRTIAQPFGCTIVHPPPMRLQWNSVFSPASAWRPTANTLPTLQLNLLHHRPSK